MHDLMWADGGARTETDRDAEAAAVVEAFLDRDLVDAETQAELRRLLAADRPVDALRIATERRRQRR